MTIVCVKGMSANFEWGQRQEKPAADWGCNTSSPATGLVGMRVLEVPVVEKDKVSFQVDENILILGYGDFVKLLLLLLSRFSRVRLCATPWTVAYQDSPSMGFSRQEHWSGLPFPSPMNESGN